MIRRCSICHVYGCRHVNPRMTPINSLLDSSSFSLGETLGDAMENFSGVVNRNPLRDPNPELATEKKTRVAIPPPSTNNNDMTSNKIITMDNAKSFKDDWVHCNICKANVQIDYLDRHLKVHTYNYKPISSATTVEDKPATQQASSAIVHQPAANNQTNTQQSSPATSKPGIQTIQREEGYKFRVLENTCCAASNSKNGRYSDFTIIFWEKDKPTVNSTVYSGGSTTYVSKDWERFAVHIVYDSVEDYYTVSCKLLKRSQYSSYDNEDGVPDRICYQHELLTEIKRALLFYRISPKVAYKHFRKLFSQKIVVERDETDKKVIYAQTENCAPLHERLKKTHTYSGYNHYSD